MSIVIKLDAIYTVTRLTKQTTLDTVQNRSGWRRCIDGMTSLPGQSTDDERRKGLDSTA